MIDYSVAVHHYHPPTISVAPPTPRRRWRSSPISVGRHTIASGEAQGAATSLPDDRAEALAEARWEALQAEGGHGQSDGED